MDLLFRPRAIEDLDTIWSWWWEVSSPERADQQLREIQRVLELVCTHPQMGKQREDLPTLQGVRSIVVDRYVVFYQIGPSAIEVLRVLDGRRDLEGLDW